MCRVPSCTGPSSPVIYLFLSAAGLIACLILWAPSVSDFLFLLSTISWHFFFKRSGSWENRSETQIYLREFSGVTSRGGALVEVGQVTVQAPAGPWERHPALPTD